MYVQICAICSGGFTGFYGSGEAEMNRRTKNAAVERGDMTAAAPHMHVWTTHVFIFGFLKFDFKAARNLFLLKGKINKVNDVQRLETFISWDAEESWTEELWCLLCIFLQFVILSVAKFTCFGVPVLEQHLITPWTWPGICCYNLQSALVTHSPTET